jgi:myo-inositol-1(or 4)-monophosphatase
MENRKITAGTIFDPARNEFYFSEIGTGAFLNGRRIRVSGRRKMADCLFSTGIPFLGRGTPESDKLFLAEMKTIMQASSGVRRFGAAALDLAFVAAGRYDGFWERGLSLWDIAAGYLLVKEAGGFISDFSARDNCLTTGEVVAANGAMHIPLLNQLREAKSTLSS